MAAWAEMTEDALSLGFVLRAVTSARVPAVSRGALLALSLSPQNGPGTLKPMVFSGSIPCFPRPGLTDHGRHQPKGPWDSLPGYPAHQPTCRPDPWPLSPAPRILVTNNQLFSSSYDRTARAWSVDKGQVSREFRGHRNCVLTLAYSAPWDLPGAPFQEEAVAGGLLVTGSTDGTAKVWQVASGCCHQTLRGHTGAVLCLVLDTPSHTAFTGGTDATVRAWDILSGAQLRVFREHRGSVICLEVSAARPVTPPHPSAGAPGCPLLPCPRVPAAPAA